MWIPFESPESRAIRENMRPEERERWQREGKRCGEAVANYNKIPVLSTSFTPP
jgi:hypothetical protein